MADEALLARIETFEAAVAEFRAQIESARADASDPCTVAFCERRTDRRSRSRCSG